MFLFSYVKCFFKIRRCMYSIFIYDAHCEYIYRYRYDIYIYFNISCCDGICSSVCYLEVHVWFHFYVYLIELTLGERFGARDDWDLFGSSS